MRGDDKPGDLLDVSPEQLLQLPPLHTILRGGKRSGTKSVPRHPGGTLHRDRHPGTVLRRQGRQQSLAAGVQRPRHRQGSRRTTTSAASTARLTDVWPEEQVQEAAKLIARFAAPIDPPTDVAAADAAEPDRRLWKRPWRRARDKWPTGLCRRLWDFLAEVADQRRRSPAHLSRWYNLVGFCLRPGFGDPLDRFRVEQLWKMLHARQDRPGRQQGSRQAEGGADYWIMWRRVAGGLNAPLQNTLYQPPAAVLLPAKGKDVVKPGANELAEMWRAAASLERLDVKQKDALGEALLQDLPPQPGADPRLLGPDAAGGPRPALRPAQRGACIRRSSQGWLDALLAFEPGNDSERLAWAFCLTQLARRSGQRALDIDDSHRQQRADGAAVRCRCRPTGAGWSRRWSSWKARSKRRCSARRCRSGCGWRLRRNEGEVLSFQLPC